ncbi:MAG: hypothetical protein MUE64_05360 [Ignavibacteriaceae bacterium]|nr:hypothetical protein [Ignavibacteriaceae bacterium]
MKSKLLGMFVLSPHIEFILRTHQISNYLIHFNKNDLPSLTRRQTGFT